MEPLSDEFRQITRLHYDDERSHSETAERLPIQVDAARRQFKAAQSPF